MTGWTSMTLRDAGITLIDCVHATPPAVEDGYPYVTIPQMKGGRITFEGARRISAANFEEWTKKARPQRHDVVLSRRTNPGVTATFDDADFALGQNLVLLRSDGSRLAPELLKWLVQTPDWWGQISKFNNVGAVFDSLRCADVPNFELPIPPLDAQSGIAEVLGSLDDKIETNRRMNETMEGIARALFKSWFIDFAPVRAKSEGRDTGLSSDTADIFPGALRSENGAEVPVGWTRQSLSLCGRFLNGLALQKYPASSEGFLPVIKIAELRAGRWNDGDRAALTIPPDYVVNDGDLLFSWSGSLIHRIWCGGLGALNQHLFKVTSDSLPQWFLFEAIQQHMPDFQAIAADKATTMGHIQRRHLDEAMVAVPSRAVIDAADEIISPIYDRMLIARKQSRTLSALRDLLLPKLMSGAIRVRDAEKMLEQVA